VPSERQLNGAVHSHKYLSETRLSKKMT